MQYEYCFDYFACQTCTARINCKKCEERAVSALVREPEIKKVDINMASKQIVLETDLDDEDMVLDMLEMVGIMADQEKGCEDYRVNMMIIWFANRNCESTGCHTDGKV